MGTTTMTPEAESPAGDIPRNVSAKSSYVGGELFRRLANHAIVRKSGWVFPSGASFRCFPDDETKYRKPDIAVVSPARYTAEQYDEEDHVTVCPDLVVRVTAPKDLFCDESKSREEWLGAGVQVVWQIDPYVRWVHVYRADGSVTLFRESDTLTGDPVLPGFAVPVADLFRLPVPPVPAG